MFWNADKLKFANVGIKFISSVCFHLNVSIFMCQVIKKNQHGTTLKQCRTKILLKTTLCIAMISQIIVSKCQLTLFTVKVRIVFSSKNCFPKSWKFHLWNQNSSVQYTGWQANFHTLEFYHKMCINTLDPSKLD